MDPIEIYVRVKDFDTLVKIELHPSLLNDENNDVLWESSGDYRLEAYQCGNHPSVCSIEKDPRILNPKHDLTLLILDSIKKESISAELL